MAFIRKGSEIISFADFEDVFVTDQRIFDANEGLTDDIVEQHLIRSTERILSKIRATDWWRRYYVHRDPSIIDTASITVPAVNPNKIRGRQSDFTELCVMTALSDYILPNIADFGSAETSERQKMSYYSQRSDMLFNELIRNGDWYDFDGDGVIDISEKSPGVVNMRRVR